jgi:tetratricopeptide (TPR) repeat protein
MGEGNPETAGLKRILAQDLVREKKLAKAAVLAKEALIDLERAYGPAHPRVVLSLNLLGQIELESGECRNAATHLRSAMAMFRKDPEGDYIAIALWNLGSAYLKCGEYRNAEHSFSDSVRAFCKPSRTGPLARLAPRWGWQKRYCGNDAIGTPKQPLLSSLPGAPMGERDQAAAFE